MRLTFIVTLILAAPALAAAQTQPAPVDPALPAVTSNTPLVWVITTDGQERKGRLVSFTSERLIVQVEKANQTINFAEIARVDTTDAISNGVRNGAITGAVLGGLFYGLAIASICEDDCGGELVVGGIFAVGVYTAIGAGLGAWIDHLVDGRRAIYTRASPSRVSVRPVIGPTRQGVLVRFAW
jgi:hypothetical protein